MALVPTVVADGAKICELAKARHGSVKAFAISIGRHPNAIWNMRQARFRDVSVKSATQIASALGVEVSEITITDEAEPEDGPLQRAG
jgi:hypothetical protein